VTAEQPETCRREFSETHAWPTWPARRSHPRAASGTDPKYLFNAIAFFGGIALLPLVLFLVLRWILRGFRDSSRTGS